MTVLKELVGEALSILDRLNTRIEDNIISRAATLKPQVVSLAKRVQDLIDITKKVFVSIEKAYGDVEAPRTIIVEPLWSISVLENRLVITRHKPKTISVSYVKPEESILIRSKDYYVELRAGAIKLGRLVLSLEVDPADGEELAKKQEDIKYVLKKVVPEVELMSISAEKKFMK